MNRIRLLPGALALAATTVAASGGARESSLAIVGAVVLDGRGGHPPSAAPCSSGEAGLTPLEALRAATADAASLLNASDEWGTIGPGRRADIVLVRGRPDREVGATRRIQVVIRGGRVLEREGLKLDPESDPGFEVSAPLSSHP